MRRRKIDIEQLNDQENAIRTCSDADIAMSELGFTVLKCPCCHGLYDPETQMIEHMEPNLV